ncbi:MAG: DUF2934 domain-containing protein [Verrucomicrobiae bacterium]|nr:DUF2934 domain-containing protein [Verrucomicrobiae bacterium]
MAARSSTILGDFRTSRAGWHANRFGKSSMNDTGATATPDERKKSANSDPAEDQKKEIAEIASHVYELREGKEGTPVDDWLKAEAILARRERAAAVEQPLVDHSTTATAPRQDAETPPGGASTN